MHPSHKDIYAISNLLEGKSSLFRQFWDIGRPIFTKDILTAAISFDSSGNAISFLWNEDMWNNLDVYTRAFIASHEMLHIILNHGKRMLVHKHDENSNKAMDIVVNHLLVNDFGFDRDKLCIPWKDYCWVDTIFSEPNIPLSNKSYEYYYNLLDSVESNSISLMDTHGILGSSCEDIQDELASKIDSSDICKNTLDIIRENALSFDIFAGSELGQKINVLNREVKIVKKWENVIAPSHFKKIKTTKLDDTWIKESRRLTDFLSENRNMFMQSKSEVEGIYKQKYYSNIWFFMDYSGSCTRYFQTFLDAARSLNKRKFKVKLFTFDVTTTEVLDGTAPSEGGGGTNFNCIDLKVKQLIKSGEEHPTAIFVITDGYSLSKIYPEFPEKWHWFLTDKHTTNYIPEKSILHNLYDYLNV